MMVDPWRCLDLRWEGLDLQVLPGIGGRLWDVRFQGRSILFQNPDLLGLPVDLSNLAALPTQSPQFAFPLWGGEKTWIAPDTAWPGGAPYPQLDSGAYQVLSRSDTHIAMTSHVCPISQLSVRRQITLVSSNQWTIDHAVTNHGASPRKAGVWSVMMLKNPALIGAAMPRPTAQPVFGDSTSCVRDVEGGVIVTCDRLQEFKVGLPNPDGAALIKCGDNGPWLMCSTPKPGAQDDYAHGQPLEVFNSGDYAYCEAEWHSPAMDLSPGETLTFQQAFSIWMDVCPQPVRASTTMNNGLLSCMS